MTLYTIYWMDQDNNPYAFQTSDLLESLAKTKELRENKFCFNVTMCSTNTDMVGKFGVDQVKDGKTPDGVEYSWVKRRDGVQ